MEYIKKIVKNRKSIKISFSFFKWLLIGSVIGVLCGTASAIFLHLLKAVTNFRENNYYLIFFLPVAGAAVAYIYLKAGKNSLKGNNLILEEIQDKNEKIPFRMGVLVLFSTIVSHLFGASVGREGTAVQMGGALSEQVGRFLKVNEEERKIILMSGISGGFGAVFGTPLAGTLFGMEVSETGNIKYEAVIPCFMASFIGDIVTRGLLIKHDIYIIEFIPKESIWLFIKVIIASIIFGIAAIVFSESIHYMKNVFAGKVKNPVLRPVIGGVIVIVLTLVSGTTMYNGIGTSIISKSFTENLPDLTFLWKMVFTSISLGSGFQGGEVTPIFYVGSALGNTLAGIMNEPVSFFAALGFIAVFSGCSNAPIACFLMGIELFGSAGALYLFMASIISYIFSGHHGIYNSQIIATAKSKLLHSDEGKKLGNIKEENK